MQRKIVQFKWEDEEAQACFAEWVPFPDAKETAIEIDTIEQFLGIRPPLRILDVGCGNGRQSIELARRGYDVTGIDVAGTFLEDARKSAKEAGVTASLQLMRASELQTDRAFDLALAYWHTIGFMSDDEIHSHFTAIHRSLKPKGQFLYVFQGPRWVWNDHKLPGPPVRDWKEQDGRFILSEKLFTDGYRDETAIVIDTTKDEVIEYREHQRAFRLDEIVRILKDAGFSVVQAFNDFERAAATPEEFYIFHCTC